MPQSDSESAWSRAATAPLEDTGISNGLLSSLLHMPVSEIDDIFASKGASKAQPVASSSTLPAKSKKKDKKRKRALESVSAVAVEKTSKPSKPIPETVLDPSLAATSTKPDVHAKKHHDVAGPPSKKLKIAKKDDAKFKDSRGSGPRRKTEEGFSIYKEDELGILDEGGDTPLCPFDCDCCTFAQFFLSIY
ncbi:DUF1764-domain-containing protein [Artomyces pyxidatus]|uniref:DUF1764-domain-containing protein n=1 Tax=Artomyces pyxidatus TaxID=48021 RepID=A0ACB8TIQ8_9AGAM|nr:DUF1764-domain-containing protein [Artomyces pyxidatus]